MFKKIESTTIRQLFLISLLLLVLPLAACDTLSDSAPVALSEQAETIAPVGVTSIEANEIVQTAAEPAAVEPADSTVADDSVANSVTTSGLSIDETADLLFMREEEKLARDVYLALYEQWGTPAFQNIAASEQAHMDALLGLINQYGLQDPAAGNSAGVFSDPTLQDLYDQLIAAGSQSLPDALIVGATVEEIDILDLQGSLAQTRNSTIVPVYQNLLAGSENHLIAFVSSWERQTGETYQSQYLNPNEYADIMGSSFASNGQGQGGTGQGQAGQGGRGQGGSGGGQGQDGQGGQGANGSRGQKGYGAGRGANGGNTDNNQAGTSGRGQQRTTTS